MVLRRAQTFAQVVAAGTLGGSVRDAEAKAVVDAAIVVST